MYSPKTYETQYPTISVVLHVARRRIIVLCAVHKKARPTVFGHLLNVLNTPVRLSALSLVNSIVGLTRAPHAKPLLSCTPHSATAVLRPTLRHCCLAPHTLPLLSYASRSATAVLRPTLRRCCLTLHTPPLLSYTPHCASCPDQSLMKYLHCLNDHKGALL